MNIKLTNTLRGKERKRRKNRYANYGVGEDSRVPWTARRFNQSILKEISPGISLEGMMLELKLQYFGHLMRRVDSLEKTLMMGGKFGGEWIHVYVWLSPSAEHLSLSQDC